MWKSEAQNTIEPAMGLAKDWLQKQIEGWNIAALEQKKAALEQKKREAASKRSRKTNSPKSLAALAEHRIPSQNRVLEVTLAEAEKVTADLDLSIIQVLDLVFIHLDGVQTWCSTVGFADMRGTKNTQNIYVELDTFVTPARLHVDRSERSATIPLSAALAHRSKHCIILGQPGAGKTTAMKKLCIDDGRPPDHGFPILIRFKDLSGPVTPGRFLTEALARIFGFRVRVNLPPSFLHDFKDLDREAFLVFLDGLDALIIFDGFDEFYDDTSKQNLANEIRWLALRLARTKIVVTCRTGEFDYHVDNCDTFEIAPLSIEQIREFSDKWLGDSAKAQKFTDEVYSSPFADTAIKPLSLAHLCAIYERFGKIPDKPKTVYRKIVTLFIEEWDSQRSIRRSSKYAGFEPDQKFEFLSHLAYYLTVSKRSSVFTNRDFLEGYSSIRQYFALPREDGHLVASELESHTGLFLQTGYDQFEFAHKSLQEYLAAEYIVRLPSMPMDLEIIKQLGAEIAIAVSISSNCTEYITYLGLGAFASARLSGNFWNVFINRLIVEKPDFYQTEAAAIAVYNLLSLWCSYGEAITASSAPKHQIDMDVYESVLALFHGGNLSRAVQAHYILKAGTELREEMLVVMRKPRRDAVKIGAGKYECPPYLLLPAAHARRYFPDAISNGTSRKASTKARL